jgi:hypothetical protein
MKYLCLCYYDPKIANTLSSSEMEALSAACQPHYEAWENTGRLILLGGLSDPQAWKSIRPTDTPDNAHSQPVVTDGPYLPIRERIGAFFFVEANDINEAVQIAARHPDAHTGRFLGGGIEVCVCESFEAREAAQGHAQ